MKRETDTKEGTPEEPQGSLLMNIGKTVFLVAVLVAAWFILEKLMGNK